MFSRAALAALLASCFPLSLTAQIDSEGMDDLTAWGARYLSSTETEFPISLWSGSDDETLLALLRSTDTSHLTQAERKLLRRIVLSPTRKPTGDLAEALLAERARLMLALGEAEAAADIAPRLQQNDHGLDAETIAVDLELARGREASACDRLSGDVPETEYWLKLRAVCAVLQENFSGAELAVEFASSQGLDDPWFVDAIFAASGDVADLPNAKFDTGMNIALSAKANLDLTDAALATSRPDLAAAALSRDGVPNMVRAQLAQIASEVDFITPDTRRDILMQLLAEEGFMPSSAIEQALQTLSDPKIDFGLKAEELAAVLDNASHGPMIHYAATAQLFHTDLKRLWKAESSDAYALTFARATLAANDGALSRRWLAKLDDDGAVQPDPFDIAMLEALDLISGGEASATAQYTIQLRLIDSVSSQEQAERAARIFASWAGFDIDLGAEARQFLGEQADGGVNVEPYKLMAIRAAAQSGAIGEAALMVLAQTNGTPQDLTGADLAALISILREIGAGDIAADLALEASEFWTIQSSEPQSG